MIYLDNAATSWPKPPEVLRAITDFLETAGGNPGRSGHSLSIKAGRIVYDAREALAELFNAPDPLRVIFTQNATYAINLGLLGIVRPGDRVITSGIEHNSVMRPLRDLERKGVTVTVLACNPDGTVDTDRLESAITPGTRLVVMTHAGNVTGTILPVSEAAAAAHRAGALFMLDAAQTAGVLPIDMKEMGIDLLAFTGHKGLQGPPGTGGLVIGERLDTGIMEPIVRGGTGSRSEHEYQPEDYPDRFESGTPNGAGIAGLGAGVRWVMRHGIERIRIHERELTGILMNELGKIPGIRVYGPKHPSNRVGVVSFTAGERRVSDVGFLLDEEHGVMARVGLHCAPAAHRTIGTFPEGTIRFAPGTMSSEHEIHDAIRAVEQIMEMQQ